jgi:CBS domain-containing protein
MRVVDVMMGTPYQCRPDENLGTATELMWKGNCGFLPVVGEDGKVVGVITDRDICVALGTRNSVAGELTVAEVMSGTVRSCAPEDEIHVALQTMRDGHVRRLPVITKNGALVGVISIDDILVRAEPVSLGKMPELSSDEVVRTFRAINSWQLPQVFVKKAVAA